MAAKLRVTLKLTHKNPDLARRLAAASTDGVNRAADFAVDELRKVVSTPNPFRGNRRNQDAGQPPFKRTGEGMDSIKRSGVGTIEFLNRMEILDTGTARIKPRPWYHVTLDRLKGELVKIAMGR